MQILQFRGNRVGTNWVRKDAVHGIWYKYCEPHKEWIDNKVAKGRKFEVEYIEDREAGGGSKNAMCENKGAKGGER